MASEVSSSVDEAPTPPGARATGDVWMLHHGDGWLLDAVTYPIPSESPDRIGQRAIRWRADYVTATAPMDDDIVTVTGHASPVEDIAKGMLAGYDFEPIEVGSWPALAGVTPPPASGDPPTVLIDVGDGYTIHVYTYGLSLGELIAWTRELVVVGEDEWLAAGADALGTATPAEVIEGFNVPAGFEFARDETNEEGDLTRVFSTNLTADKACEALATSFDGWPTPHDFDTFGVEQDDTGITYGFCLMQGSTQGHFVSGGVFPVGGEVPAGDQPDAVEMRVTAFV